MCGGGGGVGGGGVGWGGWGGVGTYLFWNLKAMHNSLLLKLISIL